MIKVLLVDDEKLERVLIRKGFQWEENGFEIIGEVSNGFEALEFIQHKKPDIIFTDISMPKMDGLELCEKLITVIPECYIVIITGYREFDYARKAVQLGVKDFLLKPVNIEDIKNITDKIKLKIQENLQKEQNYIAKIQQLEDRVMVNQDIVMESFLQRLLESRIEQSEAITKLNMYNCIELLNGCICVNIQLQEEADETKNKVNIEHVIKLIRHKEYEDTICFLHYLNSIIIYFMEREVDDVTVICEQLQEHIFSQTNIVNTIGISQKQYGYDGITKAYKESTKTLRGAVLLGRNKVILYTQYDEILKREQSKIDIQWEEFIFGIHNCLIEKVDAYILQYCKLIRESSIAEQSHLALLSMNMLSKAGNTLNKYGQTLVELLGEDVVYDEMKSLSTVDEAQKYLQKTIRKIMNYHEGKKIKQGNKTVLEALEYVNKQIFDPELSLKTVAAQIFTNESYLSRIFKKEMGISLIEYISKRRIDESIQLLNTTDLKVYEIAEKIGFRDSHYFSICFKKQTGVTIKEFKKNKFVGNEK
ncbi:MAG: response regulator [Eubacteriales bacterium]